MPTPSRDDYRAERRERLSEEVRHDRCDSCGAPVLTALVGRTAALKVVVDPTPVGLPAVREARCQGRLAWLHRAGHPWLRDRLAWLGRTPLVPPYWRNPYWGLVLDHQCAGTPDRREEMIDYFVRDEDDMAEDEIDPFGLDGADETVKRDHYGRYLLPHPATGREEAFQRATTFNKIATDQFNLQAWRMRNVAVGLAKRPDLMELAANLDVTLDKKELNRICEQAETAAGSNSAANRGTALHKATEVYDVTGKLSKVSPVHRPRVKEYAAALKAAGITIVPGLIERRVVHTGYRVGGTFDRIGELSPEALATFGADPAGGDRVIVDYKTGRTLDYGMAEIAIQLVIYADGFNANGVYDPVADTWERTHGQVRSDFALIVHQPAALPELGVTIYRVDLEPGRHGADVCASVRSYRKGKPVVYRLGESVMPPTGPRAVVKADWGSLVLEAGSVKELIVIRDRAKGAGDWSDVLAQACKDRRAEIEA